MAGKPGRPRKEGGPDPVRSLRSGAVYDRASAIATERGTTVSAVINEALVAYVTKHDDDLNRVSNVPTQHN